jgi:NTP pyrophosphatase (non-canonical NTP hydrolase)
LDYWGSEQKRDEVWKSFVKGAKILGGIATTVAVKKTLGVGVELDAPEPSKSEVAEVKKEIQKIINLIVYDEKNPLKKVVFFVDDLDRIDPPTAVEVLEALKNIFDVDNCVFILAIDYDVVIKGLEKKFGKKTAANEREFRSFFDKIIQVPFTMPTGAYDIDNLLKVSLNDLGLNVDPELESEYVKFATLTVGYVPRSIKRYVNSFSLLSRIRPLGAAGKMSELIDFCLFALLGIQISYPKIYRLINRECDFVEWDRSFAKLNGVDDISVPDKTAKVTDEEWEQVLWSFCQLDPYLKARALEIIEALNLLRKTLGENLGDIMRQSLEFASMTSVDDDVATRHATKRGVKDTNRYILTDSKGKEYKVDDLGQFCDERGLYPSNLRKVAQKKLKSSGGWKCRYTDEG